MSTRAVVICVMLVLAAPFAVSVAFLLTSQPFILGGATFALCACAVTIVLLFVVYDVRWRTLVGEEPDRKRTILLLLSFIAFPIAIGLFFLLEPPWCSDHQFVNTYVSPWGFLMYLTLFVLATIYAWKSTSDLRRVMIKNCGLIVALIVLNAFLGTYFLEKPVITHAWYAWLPEERVSVALTNILTSWIPSLLLVLLCVGVRNELMPFVFMLLVWGYFIASEFRILTTFGIE